MKNSGIIMRLQYISAIFILIILASCNLTTDPKLDPSDYDISSVPYDNQVHPFSGDSVNVYWKCKHPPLKISFFDQSQNLLEAIIPPSSRLDTLSDSSWTVGFGSVKQREVYKWQITVKDDKNTLITGPMWDFQFTPGGNTKGRLLKFIEQNVYLPHNVQVIFQAVDLYDVGDTSLTRNNFEITDDGTHPIDEEYIWDVKRINPPYVTKIVLLLDASYSVKSSPEFIKMKDEAYKFVDTYFSAAIDSTKAIELWKFSDKMEKLADLTHNKYNVLPKIQSLNDTMITTDLYGSVIKATDQFEEELKKDKIKETLIIIFTDGSDTQGRFTLNAARSSGINKSVLIVNTDPTETYKYYLNELNTFKNYINNDHRKVLDVTRDFHKNTMLTAKSVYGLFYFSPKRGPNKHDLSIILKNDAYLGFGSVIKTTYRSDGFY